MDGNDIYEVSENVHQAIKCAKKGLTPSSDGLIIQKKRKIDTIFHKDIPRKKYKPRDQRKGKHYYSRRVRKKNGNYEAVLQSQDIYRKRS